MGLAVGHGQLARQLCEALDLERCRSFKISGGVGEVVTVEAMCYVKEDQLEKVVKVLEERER